MSRRYRGIVLPSWLVGVVLVFGIVRFGITMAFRFLTGRAMDGRQRTDATFFHPGTTAITETGAKNETARPSRWAMLPGWKRLAFRIGTPFALMTASAAYQAEPGLFQAGVGTTGTVVGARLLVTARRRWRMRRFRKLYIKPLARVVGPKVDIPVYISPDKWLTVSPALEGLTPRLAKPMSPTEKTIRKAYAQHVEQGLRWGPDRAMRMYWWLAKRAIVQNVAEKFATPQEEKGPRIEMRIPNTFITPDHKQFIKYAIVEKLGLHDLETSWDQVGSVATGTWTVRVRPPGSCGFDDIMRYIDQCEEWEFFIGLGPASKEYPGGVPVFISLKDDAPHIACSAGSGAGKSVLAMLIAVQVLRRGGRVLILDKKGSHRWARGMSGITYCTKPADMHAALIGTESIADARNTQAMEEEEDWNPGDRIFVIFEEMNATVAQLKSYWAKVREKSDPKTSPAIEAFRNLMYMGRSAKCNLFGVAQMLTANTTGGPEARENFGIRCLARYTVNNWKMLVPEVPMPRKSKTIGRWQIVTGGEATETQVGFLFTHEARMVAQPQGAATPAGVPVSPPTPTPRSDQRGHDGTQPVGDSAEGGVTDPFAAPVTLQEALDLGIITGKYETVRKRMQRAREAGENVPKPIGTRGRADLYQQADLIEWSTPAKAGGQS